MTGQPRRACRHRPSSPALSTATTLQSRLPTAPPIPCGPTPGRSTCSYARAPEPPAHHPRCARAAQSTPPSPTIKTSMPLRCPSDRPALEAVRPSVAYNGGRTVAIWPSAAQRAEPACRCGGHPERRCLRRRPYGGIDVDGPELSVVDVGAVVGLVAIGGHEERPELVVERRQALIVAEEETPRVGCLQM